MPGGYLVQTSKSAHPLRLCFRTLSPDLGAPSTFLLSIYSTQLEEPPVAPAKSTPVCMQVSFRRKSAGKCLPRARSASAPRAPTSPSIKEEKGGGARGQTRSPLGVPLTLLFTLKSKPKLNCNGVPIRGTF